MDPSDKHHWQPAAGQLGPPSSPAVTRCVGANAQGHGRNYSQPVPLADIRPLRVRKFGASMSAAGDRNASWQDGAVQQGMVSRRPVHQTQCGSAPLTWPSNAGERNHAWRDGMTVPLLSCLTNPVCHQFIRLASRIPEIVSIYGIELFLRQAPLPEGWI